MSELLFSTDPSWADAALEQPLALLDDHAHCELGAAASAQALIHRHPELSSLVEHLARLAVEELEHFRRVHDLLLARGARLSLPSPNPYVDGLLKGARGTRELGNDKLDAKHAALLDRLLVAGLIEARSHERFELLAERATDSALAKLYTELGPSERGHAAMFPRLARELFSAERVACRLARLLRIEADVVRALPFAPRVHSGVPVSRVQVDGSESTELSTA